MLATSPASPHKRVTATKTARPGSVRALPRAAAAGSAHACHIGARNEPGTPSQSVVASTTADGGARATLQPVPSTSPPLRQRGALPALAASTRACATAHSGSTPGLHSSKAGSLTALQRRQGGVPRWLAARLVGRCPAETAASDILKDLSLKSQHDHE